MIRDVPRARALLVLPTLSLWACINTTAGPTDATAEADAGAQADASGFPDAMGFADATGLPDAMGFPDAQTQSGDSGVHPDATVADAGTSGVNCQTPDLLFCDDFEAYAAGNAQSNKWRNNTASANSTLQIETDAAHVRGQKSLHVHANQNEFSYIRVTNFAPPNNSFFGRVWTYVDAFPSAPAYAHWTMVETTGQNPPNLGVIRPIGGQYDPQGNAADWGVGSDGGPTGDWCNWNPQAPTHPGQWVCLEWEVRASDTSIRVWIDGTAHPELTVTAANKAGLVFPTFDSVWFGWWLYQGGPTPDHYDVWFDDIALRTTRVGCD
ncbi:MAG: hypothetical protein U1E65_29545 [Myxococcota bacterium]